MTTTVPVTAGVVAYNDARWLEASVTSLLASKLPDGFAWDRVWVVVSPSDDGTLEIAESLASRFREVEVVVEPERRGKAVALREVLRRSTGRYLVLLNGDARAEAGATAALVEAAAGASGPVALMARPIPRGLVQTWFDGAISLLWDLHHDFHEWLLESAHGSHISDEMMLVSGIELSALPEGIITDGGFIGEWVRRHGGRIAYPADARVSINPPATLRDHLEQRSRIERGHRQFGRLAGHRADTVVREALSDPGAMVRLVVHRARATPHGWRSLALLFLSELLANALAGAADFASRPVPFRWPRVAGRPPWADGRGGQPEERPAF